MNLNEKIKYYRKDLNLTQQELADLAGISLRALSNYEKGVRTPPLEILIRIAKALNIEVTTLDPNIKIWDIFDNTMDIEKLKKDVKDIEELNKNHQKTLKEVTEEIKNTSNVEDFIKSKSMVGIDNDYNEIMIKQNEFLYKLQWIAKTIRQFNEFEKDIITELTQMYSSMVYDKRYDLNKLNDEQYNKLKQNIRNSIKESFEEFENK